MMRGDAYKVLHIDRVLKQPYSVHSAVGGIVYCPDIMMERACIKRNIIHKVTVIFYQARIASKGHGDNCLLNCLLGHNKCKFLLTLSATNVPEEYHK